MKTYDLKPTKHPDVFRVVDREGNWENYYLKSKGVYLPGVTTILNRGYAKGAFFEQWLSQHTADERDQILKSAGEKGDKVHRAIDAILTCPNEFGGKFTMTRELGIYNRESQDYEPLSNEEWDALLAFASFWTAHEPQVIVSEATLYNSHYGFAGTADALLVLTKKCEVKACKCEDIVGKIGLWDWKTSSGIRASYSAQVAAYASAENLKEYLPKTHEIVEYTAILRVGTNHKTTGGYELKAFTLRETIDNFQRFLGAKAIADFEHKPFNPAEDIQDIPDVIEFTVNRFQLIPESQEAKTPVVKKVSKRKAARKSPDTKPAGRAASKKNNLSTN